MKPPGTLGVPVRFWFWDHGTTAGTAGCNVWILALLRPCELDPHCNCIDLELDCTLHCTLHQLCGKEGRHLCRILEKEDERTLELQEDFRFGATNICHETGLSEALQLRGCLLLPHGLPDRQLPILPELYLHLVPVHSGRTKHMDI